jgi:hypothetical protein
MVTHGKQLASEVAGACAYVKRPLLITLDEFVYGFELVDDAFLFFFAVDFRVDGFVVFCFASVDVYVGLMNLLS